MRTSKHYGLVNATVAWFLSILFLTLCFSYPAQALPGDLDTTFDGDGKVITNFGDFATAMAIQPNGRIIVVGDTNSSFTLARFLSNGSFDNTFSGDGKLTTDFSGSTDSAEAVAIQSDGKIVVAGRSQRDFTVARYNSDGSLDSNFSGDGKVTTDFGSNDSPVDIIIQSDNKIVVGGILFGSTTSTFGLARYNPDGTLDTTFGNSGKVITPAFSTGGSDFLQAIALQADGRIVAAGISRPSNGNNDFAIARYNTNGNLDTSFSSDGKVTTDLGDVNDLAHDVAIQADGKIVVAGNSFAQSNSPDFVLVRYNSNGSLDKSFSFDGIVATDLSNNSGDSTSAIAIQKINGRIVVAGTSNFNFALARYHAFECNGINVTILGTSGADTINGTNFATGISGINGDIIHGLGGSDTINGLAANDLICGGGGGDTIDGGTGSDTLLGQNNADSLDGGVDAGGDTDTCVGGGQAGDTFSRCETINMGSSGFSGTWINITQSCNRSGKNPACRVKGVVEVENPGSESTTVHTIAAFYLSEDEVLADRNTRTTCRKKAGG